MSILPDSFSLLRLIVLGCLLFLLSVVDIKTRELPDKLILAAALTALLRIPAEGTSALLDGLLGAFAIGVPLLFVVLLADRIAGCETMGGGDIKLIAALGLHFGALKMLLLLILACVIGILYSIGRRTEEQEIPFGPAIAVAAGVTAIIGDSVLTWYLNGFF